MSRAQNRAQLMELLGATQANTVWSWCGVNEEIRRVYFSVWSDHIYKESGGTRYLMQEPEWGVEEGRIKPARNDHDEKFRLVFEQGYEPYVYFIDPVDPTTIPRQIAGIRTSFVMKVKVSRAEC